MAKKQNQKTSDVGAGDIDGNVDKIREILFGGQMRDYEKRFAELERRLTKNIEQLSASFEKRMERLDTVSKREFEKLNEQVKSERKIRQGEGKKGARAFKQLADQVETWCAELEEQIDGETREMRGLLQESSDEAAAIIQDANERLRESLTAEMRKLADTRIAHEDLGRVLGDVAERLKKASRRSDD